MFQISGEEPQGLKEEGLQKEGLKRETTLASMHGGGRERDHISVVCFYNSMKVQTIY